MSNKRYINQIQFNPSNSDNVKKSVCDYLHKKDFRKINVNGETFYTNDTINQFNWIICLKIYFNDNVAFIEGWLVGLNIVREPKFSEEYGVDSMYGYMWRPISMLKAIISDVENLINKGK